MRETRLTTQDIILAVGYENTSYFYRVFRSRYGVTPRTTAGIEAGISFPKRGKASLESKSQDCFRENTSFSFGRAQGILKGKGRNVF